MKAVVGLFGLLAASQASPAHAWDNLNAEEEDKRCAFGQIYEDETVLFVSQNQETFDEGLVGLLVSNENWSISEGDDLGMMRLETDDGSWLNYRAHASNNGFVLFVSFEHLSNLFEGFPSGVEITRDGKLVTRLSLSGSFSVWSSFQSCRRKKVAEVEERERLERLEREIPKDPFAKQ